MRKGMTLIELMVSLVILMIVLGALYSILNLQQTRATQVARTTVLQTDAQVAFTLVKWDLLLTGLGYPYQSPDAYQLSDDGIHGPGSVLTMKAVGLGFEMTRAHWSYLLDEVRGSEMYLRRWPDSLANFQQNDTLVILNEMREPLYDDIIVMNNPRADTGWYVDSLWGDSIPQQRVQIVPAITARQGLMVFRRRGDSYYSGLAYRLYGDTLKRGNDALLTRVEAIQFRYGIDADNDDVVETWGTGNNPPFNPGYNRKWAVNFMMVITSEGMPGYRYPTNTVSFEDYPGHTYSYTLVSPYQFSRKRAILGGMVFPQNLQPGEKQ